MIDYSNVLEIEAKYKVVKGLEVESQKPNLDPAKYEVVSDFVGKNKDLDIKRPGSSSQVQSNKDLELPSANTPKGMFGFV